MYTEQFENQTISKVLPYSRGCYGAFQLVETASYVDTHFSRLKRHELATFLSSELVVSTKTRMHTNAISIYHLLLVSISFTNIILSKALFTFFQGSWPESQHRCFLHHSPPSYQLALVVFLQYHYHCHASKPSY